MKKRIRKKLCLGEFQEFGFEVQFRLPSDMSDQDQEAFFDAFWPRPSRARVLYAAAVAARTGISLSPWPIGARPRKATGKRSRSGCGNLPWFRK